MNYPRGAKMGEISRALVVDDQPGVARGVALMLERQFAVDIASGFHEAAGLVRNVVYDLVVTDLRMEYDDAGVRLLALVAQVQPSARRVLISGSQPPQVHLAHAVLAKPFDPAELERVLDERG